MEKRENLPFAHSTKELANRFLEETHMDDYMSMRIARDNLKSVLNSKLLNLKGSETPTENRNKIILAIQNNNLAFSYLALMIVDEHSLLKNWPENFRRKDLFFILGTKILKLDSHIIDLSLGIRNFGDNSTIEGIRGEMAPYKKFQQDLLKIVVPLPKAFRK